MLNINIYEIKTIMEKANCNGGKKVLNKGVDEIGGGETSGNSPQNSPAGSNSASNILEADSIPPEAGSPVPALQLDPDARDEYGFTAAEREYRKTHAALSAPKRNQAQRDKDLIDIAQWALEGYSIAEIARKIAEERPYTLSTTMVQKALNICKKEWREQAADSIEAMKDKEYVALAKQEKELWKAWRSSKTIVTRDGTTIVREHGDPCFMNIILTIRDRRARMLGLDAPARTATTVDGKVEIGGEFDPKKLTTEQLHSLVELLEIAKPAEPDRKA